jgi:hypothetical protein
MHRLRLPALVILAALLGLTGWWLINTTFMPYDDEGYVLLGYANFAAHGGLYDQIFTQYGPAPFLYYDLLHGISGWPIAHQLGRMVTLFHWVGSALLAGLMAWRLSGRYWTAWFTAAASFGYLWQMTSEPAHPGGLIAFVTALGLAGAVEAILRQRPALVARALGLAGAVLVLTKINVGLFWLCTSGAFLLLLTGQPKARPKTVWLALVGLGLLPFLLMRPLLAEAWVLSLAVMFSLSAVGVVGLLIAEDGALFRVRDWLAGGAAFAAMSLGIVLVTGHRGTSLAGIIDGVLLQPLRHPVNFHLGLNWSPGSYAVLLVSSTLTGLWIWRPEQRSRLADLIAGLRLIALGYYLWQLQAWLTISGVSGLITVALPLTPLFLVPLQSTPARIRHRQALGLVALVGLGQVLHTYPVAGSQMGWGSFLLIALFVVGLSEAMLHLAQRLRQPQWPAVVAAVALGACTLQIYWLLDTGWQRWRTSQALGLREAEFIHPPESLRSALRILTTNAQLHSDVLFSQPGMYSFNLWSGVPTPTLRNATHWFWLLSAREQQAIIDRLTATPRSAIITYRGNDAFLTDTLHMRLAGPLIDHVAAHYRPLFTLSGYEFLVPRDSKAQPFLIAENFTRRPGDAQGEASMIAVNVVADAKIDRIEVRHVSDIAKNYLVLNAANCRVLAEPINSQGQTMGPVQTLAWPLPLAGLYRLKLFHNGAEFPTLPGYQLIFLDAAGRSILEAGYNESASVSAPPAGG